MTRILVDLSTEDIDWLDRIAAEHGKSRAAVLRDAVTAFRSQSLAASEDAFGLWKRYGMNEDGLAFQRRQREAG